VSKRLNSQGAAEAERGGDAEEHQGRKAGNETDQHAQARGGEQHPRLAGDLAGDRRGKIAVVLLVGGAGNQQAGRHRR
jgi:hypothetical protein